MLLLDPSAAPWGCPAASKGLLLGAQREDSGFGLASPESPRPAKSILVQVVDKNSRRITLGEERDSRKGRQGYDWSCKVGCRRGGMKPFSRERGLGEQGSADACRLEPLRCKTHSDHRGATHTPHSAPCIPAPDPAASPSYPRALSKPALRLQGQVGPEGGAATERGLPPGSESAPADVRLLEGAPLFRAGGYGLLPWVGAPPPLTLNICRHPWCSK